MPGRPKYIAQTSLQYQTSSKAALAMADFTGRSAGLKTLRKKLEADEYVPVRGAEAAWGLDASWTTSDRKTFSCSVLAHSYRSLKTQDLAGLVRVMVKAGKETQVYEFSLYIPRGDFEKAIEYYPTAAGQIKRANSYWKAFKKCVQQRCAANCVTSLATCAPGAATLAAYLACFAVACGGCVTGCFACAGCNCKLWCKYVTGCCRR